ncbi:hypothetical protein BY996DRAFT_7305651 [Phakopsora pachyrhizi]|nr:hypothetical protein BY996DRAFT_7305651 [Phakopsora pachyrhizi]
MFCSDLIPSSPPPPPPPPLLVACASSLLIFVFLNVLWFPLTVFLLSALSLAPKGLLIVVIDDDHLRWVVGPFPPCPFTPLDLSSKLRLI